jgi:hypothetical protein
MDHQKKRRVYESPQRGLIGHWKLWVETVSAVEAVAEVVAVGAGREDLAVSVARQHVQDNRM